MVVNNELSAADAFLFERLNVTAVTSLLGTAPNYSGIYETLIPESAPLPAIRFQFQAGVDTVAIGQFRVFTRPLYLVEAVTLGDEAHTAGLIANQIEAALTGIQNYLVSPDNVIIMGCFREQPYRMVEVVEGQRFNHVGGLFRLFIQPGG